VTLCCQICDFGLARVDEPDDDVSMTREVVTQYYRAPEILMGACHYTTAVDVWSVGCVLAELLSRHILFQASGPMQQVLTALFMLICWLYNVQCLCRCSDSSCFGHNNRSYLLTYLCHNINGCFCICWLYVMRLHGFTTFCMNQLMVRLTQWTYSESCNTIYRQIKWRTICWLYSISFTHQWTQKSAW